MSLDDDSERVLRGKLEAGERVICIHYACADFYDSKDQPTAISAIGWAEATLEGNPKAEVFSIANAPSSDNLEDRELSLLQRFYDRFRGVGDSTIVHWNMNSSAYGFAALEDRYRFLGGSSAYTPNDMQLVDLDTLLGRKFGSTYIAHPKFQSICKLNGFFMPFFRTGLEEVKAYKEQDYGLIQRSAGSKAELISQLLVRYLKGTLRSNVSSGTVAFARSNLDAVDLILALFDRFTYVSRQLKRRRSGRPIFEVNDEYDFQDLLRSLLAIFFEDVRSEDAVPQQSGAASRIDFVLPDYELAIELKKVRTGLNDKELGEELVVDRDRYAAHHKVKHLVCLVVDTEGQLVNPRGLEKDLGKEASQDSIAVTVRILDR